MLLRDFIKDSARSLEVLYPAPEAASMVRILVEDMLGIDNTRLMMEPGREVSPSEEETLRSCMDRLLAGEPVQYVTGRAYFYGRYFSVCPSVLIPRQETGLLVQAVLDHVKIASVSKPRILDLCTGSGCIAWTLAAEIPGAEVTAVDISQSALDVASSQQIDIPNPPRFVKADVLTDSIPGDYDIVVSNPPYVRDSERSQMRSNVLEYEPELALFVSDSDPLVFYRAVARIARSPFGVVEINEAFAPEIEAVFRSTGYGKVATIVDFFGKNRHVTFEK